jgi:putative sterol carrier protein
MTEKTVRDLMSLMPRAFNADAAEGVNTILQYHLTGQEGGDWIVTIKEGQCQVEEGVADRANMTLTAEAQDYKDVVTGKTNAMQAFMQGKLKLSGDLTQAMKLPTYFKMG